MDDAVGTVPLLAVGLDPLLTPLPTSKGPYWIGVLAAVIALPPIPANGQLDIPATLPPFDAAVAGVPIVCQALVDGALSNPATVPLDISYATPAAATVVFSPQPLVGAGFGDRYAVGDLNDDGNLDLVVAATQEDIGNVNLAGRVYVLWGPDLTTATTLSPSSPIELGVFGQNVVIADVDGDTIDDLIVAETTGAPPVPLLPGRLHVYFGGGAFSSTPAFSIDSLGTGESFTNFGRTLTTGDFDDDGELDIAVGIPKAMDGALVNAGRIDIYFGPTYSTNTSIFSPDPGGSNFFGCRVQAGDVNGDGLSDLVEGCGRDDVGGETNIGRMHVFTGPSLQHAVTIENPQPQGFNSRFGEDVVVADFDGDGLDDIATSDQKGNAYIFWAPLFSDHQRIAHPEFLTSATAYGLWMSSGDVNSDGVLDVLISDVFSGDLTSCAPLPSSGILYAALGPYYATYHRILDSQLSCGSGFGWALSAVDIDQDGQVEIITGSDNSDLAGPSNAGHVTVFDLGP